MNDATTRYQQNISILSQFKSGNFSADLLKQYKGWGGLRKAIYDPPVYRQLKSILTDEEILSLKGTLRSAYYTPPEIVAFMYAFLDTLGFKGGAILEPAAGHGVFIEHMPEEIKKASRLDCVEIDKVTSDICKALYPDVRLYHRSFENFNPTPRYDVVIGNPPYGAQTVCDKNHADISDYCIHHYFVAKSMRLMKEGGILAMVLPSYFLDNETKHVRHIIAREGGELLAAFRLPDDLFEDAKVTIDIVFLRKGKVNQKCPSPSWTQTTKIFVDGYQRPFAINDYFHKHTSHIFGKLAVTDMYQRKGLTCRKNGVDVFESLHNMINQNKPQKDNAALKVKLQSQLDNLKCELLPPQGGSFMITLAKQI